MDNIIGRENLITGGLTNELARTLWTKYTRSVAKAYGQQNGTRQHYAIHYLAVWQAMVSVHTDPYIRKSH